MGTYSRLRAKLPESTRRKKPILNKGSLFYNHCGRLAKRTWQTRHFMCLSVWLFLLKPPIKADNAEMGTT
jgi:hypothetical protein